MRQVFERPSAINKENRSRAARKFAWAIFFSGLLFVGLGFLSHLPKFLINEVRVSGAEVLEPDSISHVVEDYLAGNSVIFFARGNILIFSKKHIAELVSDEFPRVLLVQSLERDGQMLNIKISERVPAHLWCGQEEPQYFDNFEKTKCYFLDDGGFIFAEAPSFTKGVYLAIYGGILPDQDPIRQIVQIETSMTDITKLLQALEKRGLPTHSMVVGADGQNKFLLDLRTTTGQFSQILWNEAITAEEIYNKLDSALDEESFSEEFRLHAEHLLYIDTRFKNRIFYKFEN